ncbi:MAG: hypothetical protein M4579_002328 [Chaenotheca gracillima]|nr:MAG: hypothetical protein M4579_002328 [Chaenotheca gracillima]
MAIAAIEPFMEHAFRERPLHPFFERCKDTNSTSASSDQSSDTSSASQLQTERVSNDQSRAFGAEVVNGTKDTSSLERPLETPTINFRPQGYHDPTSVSEESHTFLDSNQNPQRPPARSDHSQAYEVRQETADDYAFTSDPNSARRKRQRTDSPEMTPSTLSPDPMPIVQLASTEQDATWHQQLATAAYGDSQEVSDASPSIMAPDLPPRAHVKIEGQDHISIPSLEQPRQEVTTVKDNAIGSDFGRTGQARYDGSGDDPSQLTSILPAEQFPLKRANPGTSSTGSPPQKKKILKLNGRGKLVFPSGGEGPGSASEQSTSETVPAARKRTRDRKRKSLVVKLRYGHDPLSRKEKGVKINQILHDHTENIGSIPNKATSSEPAKPTHPFFLGKAGRDADSADTRSRANSPTHTKEPTTTHDPSQRLQIPSGDQLSKLPVSPPQRNPHSKNPLAPPLLDRPSSKSVLNGPQKFLGLWELPWPGKGMVHVRGLDNSQQRPRKNGYQDSRPPGQDHLHRKAIKLKGAVVDVNNEEYIIGVLASRLRGSNVDVPDSLPLASDKSSTQPHPNRRLPQRLLLTGAALQRSIRSQLSIPSRRFDIGLNDELGTRSVSGKADSAQLHPAISALYDKIKDSLTAFDKSEYESLPWVSKYAPTSAVTVLQSGSEAVIMREWLRNLVVDSVSSGKSEHESKTSKRSKNSDSGNPGTKRKKRKRKAGELEGFVVSSEEEDDKMEELLESPKDTQLSQRSTLAGPRSVIRTNNALDFSSETAGRVPNAIVISGPHGCGKTATAFAVAKELGFEVFEINPGSRRNGKDVLDKVGDMTRNHLVHRSDRGQSETNSEDELANAAESIRQEIETGRQGTMNSFFKAQPKNQKAARKTKKGVTTTQSENTAGLRKQVQNQQRQSLILLEEVDVLFEEDKQFWYTVLQLITQSKRPVVMTCNDETMLPMEALSLHAILRLTPPPESLGVDYLLLVAANEGHLLRRNAISALYTSKNKDLRASMMELNYWCQMAVGDQKSGLGWMIQRWPPGHDLNENGEKLRIISKDTYLPGMDSSLEAEKADLLDEHNEEVALNAWQQWGIDVEEQHRSEDLSSWCSEATRSCEESALSRRSLLEDYGEMLNCLSAQDVFASHCLTDGHKESLDVTLPLIPEKSRMDYTVGFPLLEAEPQLEYDQLSTRLAVSTKVLAREDLRKRSSRYCASAFAYLQPPSESRVQDMITHHTDADAVNHWLTRSDLAAAFDPISEPLTSSMAAQGGFQISSFDRPTSLISEDLAPYVRTIVKHDLFLEEQRRQLSNLLSEGGRGGKKLRTTRASRSALEGGNRSSTRRERWFEGDLDVESVLHTGGEGWQDTLTNLSLESQQATSAHSSIAEGMQGVSSSFTSSQSSDSM